MALTPSSVIQLFVYSSSAQHGTTVLVSAPFGDVGSEGEGATFPGGGDSPGTPLCLGYSSVRQDNSLAPLRADTKTK